MSEPASLVGALRSAEPDELESNINALIERRATARQADDRNREEESFKETTRIYNAERQEANRWQWITYYRTLARSLRTRAGEFEEKASALHPGEGRS